MNADFDKVDRKYIYKYLAAIHEFEQFISKINKIESTDYKVYEGYLINYYDYEKIKRQIHYKDLLHEGYNDINFTKEEFQRYVKRYEITDQFIKAKQIKINEPKDLIDLIQNNNKYLLIGKDLGDLICQKEEYFSCIYKYSINDTNIKFFNITFKRNNNVIDEDSYIFGNEKIINLVDSLIEYYNFEKTFNDENNKDLNYISNQSKDGKGYLVDISWIEEWKKFCKYEVFKNEIIKPKSDLIKKIYFYHKSLKIQKDLPELKPIHFNDIKTAFENNSLVLINTNFYNIFKSNDINKENQIKYKTYNDYISIIFKEKKMDLNSKNNIILDKNSASIKILIKIFNFQEMFLKTKNCNQQFNKIGMIHKIWIQNFKSEFQYENICDKVKKKKKDEEIISYIKDKIKKEDKNRFCPSFYILSKKSNNSQKELKYYKEFEIVSLDIINLLKMICRGFSNHYYEGEYYIENSKYSNILICFKDSKYNYFYELGKIYNNNLFIANYLIEFSNIISTTELIENINSNFVKDKFFENIYFYNSFYLDKMQKFKCFTHKLDYNDELECIKFTISSFYKSFIYFEKELNNSSSIKKYKNYYLINKNYFSNLKEILLYNKIFSNLTPENYNKNIYDIVEKEKNYFQDLVTKDKEKFNLYNDLNLFKGVIQFRNYHISYPIDFCFINEDIYNYLNELFKLLKINNYLVNTHYIFLFIKNDGKIIIKLNNDLILINKIKDNNIIPEIILDFDKKENQRDSFFNKFITKKFYEVFSDETIDFIYDGKNEIIGKKINIEEYISINENSEKESPIDEKELKKYLELIIKFIQKNKIIKKEIEKKISFWATINEEELYIISRKWWDEINYLFPCEINILNENMDLITNENYTINDIIDKIIPYIKNEEKIYLNKIKGKIIKNLNNLNIKVFNDSAEDNEKNNLYFHNCVIIPGEIIDLLDLESNVKKDIQKVNCIFGDNKIFMFFEHNNQYILKIGDFTDNYLFNTNLMIYYDYDKKENINKLKNMIKLKGYKYTDKYIPKSSANQNLIYSNLNIDFNIEDKLSNINLSEKTKIMFILSIYQRKFLYAKNNNNIKINFLINVNWLNKFEFNIIEESLIQMINTNKEVEKIVNSDDLNAKEIFFKLYNYFDKTKISNIDNKIKDLKTEDLNGEKFYTKYFDITLNEKGEKIGVLNDFIIVDKDIIR